MGNQLARGESRATPRATNRQSSGWLLSTVCIKLVSCRRVICHTLGYYGSEQLHLYIVINKEWPRIQINGFLDKVCLSRHCTGPEEVKYKVWIQGVKSAYSLFDYVSAPLYSVSCRRIATNLTHETSHGLYSIVVCSKVGRYCDLQQVLRIMKLRYFPTYSPNCQATNEYCCLYTAALNMWEKYQIGAPTSHEVPLRRFATPTLVVLVSSFCSWVKSRHSLKATNRSERQSWYADDIA